MIGKWLRKPLYVLVLGALLVRPATAQVAGPVEQGLAQLANQIVAKSKAAGKAAIAVLPFPNADGSCSVLSNFIADELIQSLFSVPASGLEIVERSQLETVIKELKLGASGLLNPETTKKLGSQSGVSALTVGTITVIGDTVRINARLIATDTGKAISAAAVDVPKVAAVSELLKQPITAGPTCAPLIEDGKKSVVTDAPGPSGNQQPSLHPENPGATHEKPSHKLPTANPSQLKSTIQLYLYNSDGKYLGANSIGFYQCAISEVIVCTLALTRINDSYDDYIYDSKATLEKAKLVDNLKGEHRQIRGYFLDGRGKELQQVNLAKDETVWFVQEFEGASKDITSARILFPDGKQVSGSVK